MLPRRKNQIVKREIFVYERYIVVIEQKIACKILIFVVLVQNFVELLTITVAAPFLTRPRSLNNFKPPFETI